ncbi:MAG: hypothetical protein J6I96_04965 [Oscillospiraceae bacterium]|nr:hypothetical protein [Oscillospiraceae bacterium]
MKKMITAALAVLLTACAVSPEQAETTTTTAETTVTSVETTISETTTVTSAETEAEATAEDTGTRRLFDSMELCGKEYALPLTLDVLSEDFTCKEAEEGEFSGYKTYHVFNGDDRIGLLTIKENGETESFSVFAPAECNIGGFRLSDTPKAAEEIFGKPLLEFRGILNYRYDDMYAVLWYFLAEDGKSEIVDHIDIVYGDFSDKSDKFLLEKDIQTKTNGETTADLESINHSIIVDGTEFPQFPFSEQKLPKGFDTEEYIDSQTLTYNDERIADIEIIRGSVVYIGFYAQSMEKYDISVGGIKYDTSDEDILSALGEPNCTLSTDDTLIYISDDKGLAVHTSGYRNSYSPNREPTDNNYVSVGISGRKKFRS